MNMISINKLSDNVHFLVAPYSAKILHAFLQSSVSAIQDFAKPELQLLMDREVLKAPESKFTEKAADS